MSETDNIKIRPLGALSDFIVENLATNLQLTNNKIILGEKINQLINELSPQHIELAMSNQTMRDIACLDLKMAEIAISHQGGPMPIKLHQLVNNFSSATNNLPSLSYEEIILINPAHDLRTFTCGETGLTESTFYRTHATIENCLETIIEKMAIVQESLIWKVRLSDEQLLSLEAINKIFKNIADLGANMQPHLFNNFRQYLEPLPHRGLKGPSGAHSGSIPEIEILLYGNWLSSERYNYIYKNYNYFPRHNRLKINELLHKPSLISLIDSNDYQFVSIKQFMIIIGKFLVDFSRRHVGAVARQIPEAIANKVTGTGGEPAVGTFLKGFINERVNNLNKLTGFLNQ